MGSDSGGSSYAKKYHGSPDVSALIAASRNSLLNKANLGSAAGNQSYLSTLASGRSHDSDNYGTKDDFSFTECEAKFLQSRILHHEALKAGRVEVAL